MPDKVVDLLIILSIMLSALAMTWVIMRQVRLARRESGGGARLEAENGTLRLEMARLTERVAVLERIATDPAARTALEIESLRTLPGPPDSADQ
jgi:hypothetical protein